MAMCVMAVVAVAPCQCFSPSGNQITSPGRMSSLSPDEIQCHRQCSAPPVLEILACGSLVLLKQEPASQRIFVRSRFNHSCCCVMRSVPDPDGHSGIALEVAHPVRGVTTAR